MRGHDTRTREWRLHIAKLCFVWHLMSQCDRDDEKRFLKAAWEAPVPQNHTGVKFTLPLDLEELREHLRNCPDYLVTTLECDLDDDDENLYFRAWFKTKDSAMLFRLIFG